MTAEPVPVATNPQGGTPRLSYSRLSAYSKCPASYQLKWIDNVAVEPSGAAVAGTAVHTIIEELLIGLKWYRLPSSALRPLMDQAFAVLFGNLLAESSREADCPKCAGVGRWAPMFDGKEAPINDVTTLPCPACATPGQVMGSGKVTLHGEDAVRWGGRKRIVEDENGNRVKDPTDPEGKRWLKAGEDVRWWCHEGPIMLMRAAAILRGWEELGVEVTGARVEVTVTAWLYLPWQDKAGPTSGRKEHPDWPDGMQVTGKIDAMLAMVPEGEHVDPETGELKPGTWAIVDWKSGSYLADAGWQLVVYAWLIHHQPDPALFFDVRIGYVVNLRGKAPAQQLLIEHFTDARMDFVPTRFERMAAGIRAGIFDWKPSSFCGSCWVRKGCEWWQIEGKEPE